MSKKDTDKERSSSDRRAFLRRFFKKSAPLVVGAVAKPLSRISMDAVPPSRPEGTVARKTGPTETLSEGLKKEFEDGHEEFIRHNPDFFEKP